LLSRSIARTGRSEPIGPVLAYTDAQAVKDGVRVEA